MTFLDFIDYVLMLCIGGILGIVGTLFSNKCKHKFEVIDTLDRKNMVGTRSKVYVSRCDNCGKIKRKEVK